MIVEDENLKLKFTQYCADTTKWCSVHAINCGDTDIRYKRANRKRGL